MTAKSVGGEAIFRQSLICSPRVQCLNFGLLSRAADWTKTLFHASMKSARTVNECCFEYLADHPEQGRRVVGEFSHSLAKRGIQNRFLLRSKPGFLAALEMTSGARGCSAFGKILFPFFLRCQMSNRAPTQLQLSVTFSPSLAISTFHLSFSRMIPDKTVAALGSPWIT